MNKMYHTYHPQVRDIIHDMEYRAFQHFEDISRDVLNTFWKKNLKRKGLTWKVRHRGISSDGGCIQLSLTDEWGGPYMAWIPICPMRMFTWKEYTIELYVEGDRELAAAWRKHIEEEWLLLPADGEKIKAGTSRIFRYKSMNAENRIGSNDYIIVMEDKEKLIEKAFQYLEGDEKNSIFINRKKAKEYFDKAGWDDMDCEEDTSIEWEVLEADYRLTGSPTTLDGIRTMIEELTHRYGTPDNELGLYVPLEALMQVLVGSPHYHGNLIRVKEDTHNCLVLHVEADTTEPLLYALRQAFPNITVETEECFR